jgi:hypothetical protein
LLAHQYGANGTKVEEKEMNGLKAFAAASCLGLASLALAPSAMADQWNKKTIITVGEPIQVPGKVLQPGKYVMRLMDSPSNRHIVQIFNEREDQLQTTILAIPNYRLQPTGNTEFQWWETPAGQPKALRAWFYPGDNFGQEFAYPKNEAVSIAATANTNVPTTYAQTEAELATARVGTVDRAGTEMELDRQTYSRADGMQSNEVAQNRTTQTPAADAGVATQQATPTPATEMQRQTVTADQTAAADAGGAGADQLPRTASPVPMVGLAGLLALGASIAVRKLRA